MLHAYSQYRYKLVLRAQPRSLVVWRELAACYEQWGLRHASTAALKCGAQTRCPVADDGDGDGAGAGARSGAGSNKKLRGSYARAAPLYLQMAANILSMPSGREEEQEEDASAAGLERGLASVGDAFRFGKGGAAGHVLRGLIHSRLGKDGHATSAFAKAKEAGLDPAMAVLLDQLAATQGAASVDGC